MELGSDIKSIKGIGEKTAALFARVGVLTVRDLLNYYPRSYEVYEKPLTFREARYRDKCAVFGYLVTAPVTRYVKKLKITDAMIRDEEGGTMKLSWFNMPYLQKTLHAGASYVFYGKLEGSGLVRRMAQPKIFKKADYEELEKTLCPVYPLVKDLTGKTVQNAVKAVFNEGLNLPESLAPELLRDYDLIGLQEAIREIHFPTDRENFLTARKRLVFEEFYRFAVNVKRMKENASKEPNSFEIDLKDEVSDFIAGLPYELTNAQKKVFSEITRDLTGDSVMNRLVQGDVGSGKTIVAFLAMYLMALNGYQSVLMAPTEVLATQHFENFTAMNEKYGLGLRTELLTGSMTAKEKREAYARISTHSADLVIGTHALIQDKVHYEDLGLVVTDEQHRFGVNQRKALTDKGRMPHTLVMSATPIPRTLGMILYGDMDVSVMDERPKNRTPIKNAVVDIEYRGKAYSFIRKEVDSGHQAYVICPMVEASEVSTGEDVVSYAKALKTVLPERIRVEYLHGKMKPEEKEKIMEAFGRNEIQVLVSTTVIEVGIDVPNATVMMIENAERFGLAQLHQLRGRVGRGDAQSYCIFVDTTMSEESEKRLEILKNSNDGFFIASEDLKLRGPGDFFGVRQSGDLAFRLGDIYTDAGILEKAEDAARKTMDGEIPYVERVIL